MRLYAVFLRDFVHAQLNLEALEVWHDRRKLDGHYEEGFWHLVTREEKNTKERLLDPRRAERLPWCSPIIRNTADTHIKFWRYKEGNGKIRCYIWLFDSDYVAILEERTLQPLGDKPAKTIALLITAFYVDTWYKREDLERKYTKREA